MFKKLNLKGGELLVCAYLFAVRQYTVEFRSLRQVAEALPLGRMQTNEILKKLVERQIIKKEDSLNKQNQKMSVYRFNEDEVFEKVFGESY